ncbi:MAG: ATP-dependent helicase HrpB, partial [Synechococcaceae cyanobacterium]|nr:ATP-dependent helicase HrpB [Synechococcaceae cyanobacterium]
TTRWMESVTCADRPLALPLPIDERLPEIVDAFRPGVTLLLQAPPGAGKTTRVPLALLDSLPARERLLLIEPRRIAARAAASRLSAELGEPVGTTVGYSVRLDSRTSAATRLEVVTGGIFLHRLQADPALEGVAGVILDEFHERPADAELGLALLRQARSLLRPELRLLVMSATLDLEPLARTLDGARVVTSGGRSHPVEVHHQPPREGEPIQRQVLRALEEHWLPERREGETVLVFLPGQREIRSTQRAIAGTSWGGEVDATPLHGHLPLDAQAKAIAPARGPGGKIVLATSIAESSLTIEGVRLVIDSGLSRRNRFDPGTGMDALVTGPASRASAEQRRGRAGRLGPGRCLRLWAPAERRRRPDFDAPELLVSDPLPLALQLAAWGSPLGEDLPWLQAPHRPALERARELLRALGAVDGEGALTRHGRALARLGLHPRLGHMLLRAEAEDLLPLGCSLAVLLSERDPLDPREAGCDLLRRLAWLDQERDRARAPLHRLRRHLQRQVRIARDHADTPPGDRPAHRQRQESTEEATARLLSWAYPERIALARPGGDGRFLLRGGRGARLHPADPLGTAGGLAVAHLDGEGSEARVLLAAPLPGALLEELLEREGRAEEEARWDPEAARVRCERVLRLGALVVRREPWPDAGGERINRAMVEGLRQMGLEALPWCPRTRQLRERLCLARAHLGDPWPDRRPEVLESDPGAWLGPHLHGLRSRRDLERLDLAAALWGDSAWDRERHQALETLLPERVAVASGRRVPIDYSGGVPVLAVKLQELFGQLETPTVLDGRLPLTLHLLSPAGRPVAITQDLESFWAGGYGAVRRDLRGRYPRHPWPEDPRTALPTALTQARLRQQDQQERQAPLPR